MTSGNGAEPVAPRSSEFPTVTYGQSLRFTTDCPQRLLRCPREGKGCVPLPARAIYPTQRSKKSAYRHKCD